MTRKIESWKKDVENAPWGKRADELYDELFDHFQKTGEEFIELGIDATTAELYADIEIMTDIICDLIARIEHLEKQNEPGT